MIAAGHSRCRLPVLRHYHEENDGYGPEHERTTSGDVITAVVILGLVLVGAVGLATVWITRAVNNINRRLDHIETSLNEIHSPTQ